MNASTNLWPEMAVSAPLIMVGGDARNHAAVSGVLGGDYQLHIARDPQEALSMIDLYRPNLILLDTMLSGGFSGYELCRMWREEPATRDLQVIFFASSADAGERFKAYEAGGDDFIGMPFDVMELRAKVEAALRRGNESRRLLAEKEAAFATAMAAMSANGEIGVVLSFLRQSFACHNYVELADAIVSAVATWELSGCVLLRGNAGSVARNRSGDATPLEASVLNTLASCDRITSFGRHLAVSFAHVTIMISDLPIDQGERCGRLRDDLAWLAEAADARVAALDTELSLREQKQRLHHLVTHTGAALSEIENRRRIQKAEAVVHIQDLWEVIGHQFVALGLSDEQENVLSDVLTAAIEKVIDIFDQGLETDVHLHEIAGDLSVNGGLSAH